MEESTSKEKILKRVRKALSHKAEIETISVDMEADLYNAPEDELEIVFAHQLSELNGKFVFCLTEDDAANSIADLIKENNWGQIGCFDNDVKPILQKAQISFNTENTSATQSQVAITGCECLIARTGSVLISSRQQAGRRLPFYADYHFVVAYTNQLVRTVKDALKEVKAKYGTTPPSMLSLITGPSRTADIEKTLVQGAHGPKEIYVFLIDSKV